jgi:quercetin dioxygenase-like cupin family protein
MFGKRSQNGYTEVLPGIRIKTLVHGEGSLMTEFLLQCGSQLPFHAHPQEQTGYLIEGRIKLTVENACRVINPGDSWCIPANVTHGAEILADSRALEVFAPLREDYLQYLLPADVMDGPVS